MADKPERDVADEHYKKTFNRKNVGEELEQMEEDATTDTPDAANQTPKSTKDVKKLEEQSVEGTWKHSAVGKPKEVDSHIGRAPIGLLRHGSAFAFLIALLGLGLWFSAVFAPNIILVNIKEMFTNDLADATVALYTYDKKMLDHKLKNSGQDCSGGGSDEEAPQDQKIKCKLSTMSRNEVKRYERAGFTVNGQKLYEDNLDDKDFSNDKPESRYKVSSISFPHGGGSFSSADELEKIKDKANNLRALADSVWSSKSSFFQDERYKQRIKWRYDLTKEVTTEGSTEEAVNKAFDASMEGTDEQMDNTGGGNYSLKGLAGNTGKEGLKKTSERVAQLAYSYVGVQCAYYTQFKVTYGAMKKAKEVSVARFAMQYLKAADQIKAGLAQGDVTVNTMSSKLAWSDDGSYFGKNATDGSMYRHILYNEPPKNESKIIYTLDTFDTFGAIMPAWLITGFITQQVIKGMTNVPGNLGLPGAQPGDTGAAAREYCLEGEKDSHKIKHKPSKAPNNCGALTVGGTPPQWQPLVSWIVPIATGPGGFCPMPPPVDHGCCWMMYPPSKLTVETIMPLVASVASETASQWANQSAQNFSSKTKGRNAAEALFAGTGAILGDMAMSRGMRPGNVQSMTQYLALRDEINKEFEEVARYNARQSPFDIYNKYSFLGSLVQSAAVAYSEKAPLLSSLGNVVSLVPASVSQLGLGQSASAFYYLQPLKFDPSRLSCNDHEYDEIGIKADTLCNVRYSMSSQDLNAQPTAVLDYMLKEHPDETKKNIEELQKRVDEADRGADTIDKEDIQRQLNEAKEGSNAKMIDEKTGAPVAHSEYEKYMTYCVNREMPWGRTGMAVRYEELSQEEKAERRKYVTESGGQIQGYKGDPEELRVADGDKSAYMAVREGANADQDWYTGKKCLEESEMLKNFRAYTMMCMVDGSHAGSTDCTERDRAGYYFDGFYHNNDVLYTGWW